MEKFKTNANIVLDFMTEHHYSEHSLYQYRKIYDTMENYMMENALSYSPELGKEWLSSGSDIPLGSKSKILREAAIRKINAVYAAGSVSNVLVLSRKPYSSLKLKDSLSEILIRFTDSIRTSFSKTQAENIRRRCSLFLKYLQSCGKDDVSSITYGDISEYHFSELSHLKQPSRLMEEGSICHFLHFLSLEKQIRYSVYVYMYALETDSFIDFSSLSNSGNQSFRIHNQIQIPSVRYQRMIDDLIHEFQNAGYVTAYRKGLEKAIRYFEMFLDFYQLDYSPELSDAWLNAQRTKSVFQGSSWITARRALFLLKVYAATDKIDFDAVLPHGISGLSMLPEWMPAPLMDYSQLRAREKLDRDTVNNDIYSILRFFRFLISENISSFADVSADMLLAFNLSDRHLSSEGKNACNARIRRFLRYLYRKNIITNQHLPQLLGYSAVKKERIVTILTAEELSDIRSYIAEASTPLQLQDSAVILLGTEMGIRGCDVVRLKISDISFKNKTIRFIQDKTDVEIQLAMPVSVGNAVFRYLTSGRPKGCPSDRLFVSQKAPHKPLSRNICYDALKRVLPKRSVPGSGFHVTRKSFSTYKLRNGIDPERISSAMGQHSVKSLPPYLSLDGERLSLCPLSLKSLDISWRGGFL